MSDTKPLFDALRNSADPQVVAAIEALIREGTDRQLCRVNLVSFAVQNGLDEEKAIGGFHRSRDKAHSRSNQIIQAAQRADDCALCASGCEPTLDEMVVTRLGSSILAFSRHP